MGDGLLLLYQHYIATIPHMYLAELREWRLEIKPGVGRLVATWNWSVPRSMSIYLRLYLNIHNICMLSMYIYIYIYGIMYGLMDPTFIPKLFKCCSKCKCLVQSLQKNCDIAFPKDRFISHLFRNLWIWFYHKLYHRHNFWIDPNIVKLCENGSDRSHTWLAEKQTWLRNYMDFLVVK